MNIYGWQKVSLQDYPDKVSTILFTKGCNFRCGYCHNPELIPFEASKFISEDEVFDYLEKRKKMLEQ